jgi:hypothetical protein
LTSIRNKCGELLYVDRRGAECDPGTPFVSKLLINYYVMEIDLLDIPVPVTKKTIKLY